MAPAANPADLIGLKIAEVAGVLSLSRYGAESWLHRQGYRLSKGVVARQEDPHEAARQLAARIAAAPPSAPCFRCGAARWCEHRPMSRAA